MFYNLNLAARLLFYVGCAGQLAFAIYIFLHLGISALQNKWEVWNAGLANGIIEGDHMGNAALLLHILLAFTITLGGPLQFIPALSKKARIFHKWNGRIYVFTAIITSFAALFLVWSRPIVIGGVIGSIGTSVNALLIILFGIMTWKTGVEKNFDAHRRWAIRTFIVVSGVWFFRIGYGTWFFITWFEAPGVTDNLTGWFDTFLYFGSYLFPLIIAELYLRLSNSDSHATKRVFAVFLYLLIPLLIGGTSVTTMVFWLS